MFISLKYFTLTYLVCLRLVLCTSLNSWLQNLFIHPWIFLYDSFVLKVEYYNIFFLYPNGPSSQQNNIKLHSNFWIKICTIYYPCKNCVWHSEISSAAFKTPMKERSNSDVCSCKRADSIRTSSNRVLNAMQPRILKPVKLYSRSSVARDSWQ